MQGCKILSTFYGRDEITYNSKCQFERINMIQVNIVIEMKREIMWLRWCNNYLPSSINKGCLITYIIIVFCSSNHSSKVHSWFFKPSISIVSNNYSIFWYDVLVCISDIHTYKTLWCICRHLEKSNLCFQTTRMSRKMYNTCTCGCFTLLPWNKWSTWFAIVCNYGFMTQYFIFMLVIIEQLCCHTK